MLVWILRVLALRRDVGEVRIGPLLHKRLGKCCSFAVAVCLEINETTAQGESDLPPNIPHSTPSANLRPLARNQSQTLLLSRNS
jgi:hypothetical protein